LRSNQLSYVANGAHCPRLAYRCQPQIIDKFTFYQAVRLREWRLAESLVSEPAADLSTARTVLAGLLGDAGKSASSRLQRRRALAHEPGEHLESERRLRRSAGGA
ncbi:hypothetical protein P2Q70_13350, partial [Pseudomonas mendocina]|nr:hypothetical protein [Pseudomonas mendocina]